ncbi:MAG: HNH endonuclease [Gemmatimonadota bacterium]
MRRRIEKYRRLRPSPHEDYEIGCIILTEPLFFNEEDWIPVPEGFSKNIQQGKNYDMTQPPGRDLWDAVMTRLPRPYPQRIGDQVLWSKGFSRHRLGQGAFQMRVIDAYERRCTVTREKALPVLEAAHIRPVTEGGTHDLRNGLLLRRDLHALFDRGYLTVLRDLSLRVSNRLKKEFDDGEYYLTFDRGTLWLPRQPIDRPDPEMLEWHADTVFKG